jgi:hypothetical protein
MCRFFWMMFSCLLITGSSACISAPTTFPPLPSQTLTPSETPTATIVWFPPTATYTPLPSPTPNLEPTENLQSDHGKLIFQDGFNQPELWMNGKMTSGSIAFGKGELSLGVSQTEGYLYSLREATSIGDFFLEITASPSICRAGDEYGVLFRVSPALDFFRFGLNCQGEARLDRLISGTATSPQPPLLSGAVPPGAPSSSRLGIWASGKEMRFYVNDQYQFTVRDASLLSGGLGVFARASGEEAMSVNFSALEVYEVSP